MECIKIPRKISKPGEHVVFQDKCTQTTVLVKEACEFGDFLFKDGVNSDCKGTLETLLLFCAGETKERDWSLGPFDHRSWKAAWKLYFDGWVELPQQERVAFE